MPDLYTFGEVMALFLAQDEGSVVLAKNFERLAAGAEANVAVALSRLGLDAHFYTRLGQDLLGEAVLADLRREGVDVSQVRQTTDFTGILIRNTGQAGCVEATYARRGSAASAIEPGDIDLSVLANSRWVHLTGITAAISLSARASVAYALDRAREQRKRISLDLNIRRKLWSEKKAAEVLFPMAHDLEVLIGGVDEYQTVFGEQDPEKCLSIAVERGIVHAVMTGAERPVRVRSGTERFDVVPPQITLVDPVGAGDAFTGGVIAALLAGQDIRSAVVQGSVCGANVASSRGDWAGLPYGTGGGAAPRYLEAIR
jgi:2-dehydro-3-deoxygluconokinase